MAVKQYRGCSRFYGAEIIENEDGTVTYGIPFKIAPVKNISRTEEDASDEVWGDNEFLYDVDGGKAVNRSFEITNLSLEIEAKLLGKDVVSIGTGETGLKGFATTPNAIKPYFAFGYALHDGDADNPCEYVWAYRGKVNSISKESATIRKGDTTSNSRTIEISFLSPKKPFANTNKRNLDFNVPVVDQEEFDLTKWFDQVVTPDNASTVLNKENA